MAEAALQGDNCSSGSNVGFSILLKYQVHFEMRLRELQPPTAVIYVQLHHITDRSPGQH